MEFYEFLRKRESGLIDAIGLKSFKEEKVYFVNEVEILVGQYLEFKKLDIADVRQQSELLPIEFIEWYSGMEKQKILNAIKRWRKEKGNSA